MARAKKNADIREAMCKRFVHVMDNVLMLSAAETARKLGYSNSTTINRVKRGEAFVDVERLQRLALIEGPKGEKVDLNWIILGVGNEIRK